MKFVYKVKHTKINLKKFYHPFFSHHLTNKLKLYCKYIHCLLYREVNCKVMMKVYMLYLMDFRLFEYSLTDYLDRLGKKCHSLLPKMAV